MDHLNDLTIYLTEKCNFNCSYCYYKKDYKSSLDIEKIRAALNLFFNKIMDKSKTAYITILGGEPFLKRDLLFQTIDLIEQEQNKKKLNSKIYLFTNGSLLTKEDAEKLIRKKVRVYVSIDGIQESNDCYRKCMLSDESAFIKAINNLKTIPKKNIKKMGINMVVGPKNCKYLMKNIAFFKKFGFHSIDISLMSYAYWPKRSLKTLINQLSIFYRHYLSLFSKNKNTVPFRMYQLAELFRGGWDKMDRCNRIKLAPDGNFYFCDAFFSLPSKKRRRYKIGDINKVFLKKIDLLKEEAKKHILGIFPRTYLLHRQNKMIYCPYGVYYYCKQNKKNLRKYLKNFYLFSRIYSSLLIHLFHKLKDNKKFIEFYAKSDV